MLLIFASVIITIFPKNIGYRISGCDTGTWRRCFTHGCDGWSLGRNQCGAILRLDEAVPGQFATGQKGLGAVPGQCRGPVSLVRLEVTVKCSTNYHDLSCAYNTYIILLITYIYLYNLIYLNWEITYILKLGARWNKMTWGETSKVFIFYHHTRVEVTAHSPLHSEGHAEVKQKFSSVCVLFLSVERFWMVVPFLIDLEPPRALPPKPRPRWSRMV